MDPVYELEPDLVNDFMISSRSSPATISSRRSEARDQPSPSAESMHATGADLRDAISRLGVTGGNGQIGESSKSRILNAEKQKVVGAGGFEPPTP